MALRRQLTLFVPAEAAAPLEASRRVLDPVQHGLIAAHVTLCREDELGDLGPLRERLGQVALPTLTLGFGPPERFQGHGVLLPAVAGEEDFQALRALVLGERPARLQKPHVTLAHPRNPPTGVPVDAGQWPVVLAVTFRRLTLIEQVDATAWREVASWPLGESQG